MFISDTAFFYKVFELYTEIMGAFTDKIILCCYFFVTFKEIFRSIVICLHFFQCGDMEKTVEKMHHI